MTFRSFFLSFLFIVATSLAAGEWKISHPRPDATILYNENGDWAGIRGSSLAPLTYHTARVRKIFDMSRLPPGTLEKTENAALLIHLGIVDYSLVKNKQSPNGLNEEFVIEINGHKLTFPTADPRFPARGIPSNIPSDADSIGIRRGQTEKQVHDWVEIPFPASWLNAGQTTVEMYKKPSRNQDDFVYVGIDITVDNTATSFSFNGGKEWKTGTGSQPAGKGEYLMRLGLSSSKKPLPFLQVDDTPVDLAPVMKSPRGSRSAAPSSCTISGDTAKLVNPAFEAEFRLRPRMELLSLKAAEVSCDVIRHPGFSRLFRIKSGERIFDNRHASVRKVLPLSDGFSAEFELAGTPLCGTFTCRATGDELRFELELENTGSVPYRFLSAFPHFAGIALSERSADDYFLFPHGGGTLSNRNAALRSVYGTDGCWWQMIDLFSPERGGGLYLRCDDPKALYKGFALRKGKDVQNRYILKHGYTPGRDPKLQFTDALEEKEGIGISIDYQEYNRAPGAKLKLPAACLGTHGGNWKTAMERYAAWSKKTWPPRPPSPLLAKFWNLHGGIGHTLSTAAFTTSYLNPTEQIIEQDSYWTLSKRAPWGSSWEEFDKALKSKGGRILSWKDPVTGKRLYPLNRGDYDGYNPDWGGLEAFRTYIRKVKETGRPVTLYTDPVIACHNTENGPLLAEKYGVINPDWRDPRPVPMAPKAPVVTAYYSYCLDINAKGYPEWIAKTMARLCRETGVDGIRLDEYGHRGYICLSNKHEHLFGEAGQNAWLEAVCHSIKLVRQEFEKINPDLIIMTEFPGHDRMASLLDGALSYNTCRRIGPLAPLPLNLFRMYFPECKLFEISVNGPPEYWNYAMWNGMGACYPIYPMRYLKVLNRYGKIFSGDFESLVPTRKQYVYANRFTERNTRNSIYTLFNLTPHTWNGPVLEAKSGFRYRDLFSERDLPVENGSVSLNIESEKLGVIGEFPVENAAGRARNQKLPDIAEVDANFKTESFQGEKLRYHDVLRSADFEISGFGWRKVGGEFCRLPRNHELFGKLSPALQKLSVHTSGGTIRFCTDARRIAIRAKLRYSFDMDHMPRTGSCGFDFYLGAGTGHDLFFRNVPARREHLNGKKLETLVYKKTSAKRDFSAWTIYLPLYCGVESLEIGTEPEASFRPVRPWKVSKPVVFYGSSITQGGCASRPGNAYGTLLCRSLDAPQINLGFSGSAHGEEALAKLISELDMSAFVMDYDYNAVNAEELAKTHEKFFRIIRKAHPELPVLLLSRCTLYAPDRTAVIRKTWSNAVASGDRFVRFVEGAALIDSEAKIVASVDGCHPNDLGFYLMYRKLLPLLREMLGSPVEMEK